MLWREILIVGRNAKTRDRSSPIDLLLHCLRIDIGLFHNGPVLENSMHFLERDLLYEAEKPYELSYEAHRARPRLKVIK